jgi:hypothetical protein
MGPRVSLDAVAQWNVPPPIGNKTSAVQLIANSFIELDIEHRIRGECGHKYYVGGKGRSWHILSYYSRICLERQKSHEILSQGGQKQSKYSIVLHPEYTSGTTSRIAVF